MAVFYGNILSFLIVGIFPLVFVGILFGFKEIGFSFSTALKKDIEKDKLTKALDFFKIYGKTIWIVGFTAILIMAITMVVALEDKSGLGPNLSMILTTLLYCGIINLVIIIPFTVFIKRQMKE
jgi:flagellar motor component MotA